MNRITDVVSVHLQPPKVAVVLCVDEKSQILALDRSQLGLPLICAHCGTFTYDCQRHRKVCLFAVLHGANGRLIAAHYLS